jgi:hypothetical protein
MNTATLISALVKVHDMLYPVTTQWMLIGTTSLFLQGYQVAPNDIDIVCNEEVAVIIEQALAAHHQPFNKLVTRDKFRSRFSRYVIDGVKIELMGNLQVNASSGWVDVLKSIRQSENISLEGRTFTVPGKEEQMRIYQWFGREKDQRIIAMLES